jgi:hypothetical protein
MVDILFGKMGAYSVGAVAFVVLVTALDRVQAFASFPDYYRRHVHKAASYHGNSSPRPKYDSATSIHSTKPKPIDPSGWPEKFPAKEHCSKCGLCETTFVSHVTDACAFLGAFRSQ